jgi:hypothetical protein
VTVESDKLWDLLPSLDDPEHLQFPAGFNRDETRNRFGQLVDRLDTAFSCACEAERHVEDASYHGRVEIPAAATATGIRLVIVVSNFGGLAVVAADHPGAWTQEEFRIRRHRRRCSRPRRAEVTGGSAWEGGVAVWRAQEHMQPP